MKKTLALLLSIAYCLLFSVAFSQPLHVQGLSNSQRLLGYTLTDDIDVSGALFGEAGTYTIGAAIDPAMLTPYTGCRVVGIRIAAATGLGRTRTFVYNFTGTSFDPVIEQRQRLYEGWNNVFFNGDGYEIQGGETLFFGFDYVETADMVAADKGGLACTGDDTEGAFYIYGNYGQGEGLYTISGAGKLCVQLIIDISSLPQNDMAITYLDAGFKHKRPGERVEVLATFTNTGRDTVCTYQIGYRLDRQQTVLINCQDTIAEGMNDSWLGTVNLPDDIATGMHTLRFFVNSVNGEALDSEADGKHLDTQFAIYRDSVDRQMVYLEVYTDQDSPYSAMLNDAVRRMQQQFQQVCVVNVHRPGTRLAVSDADYLSSLYAYTYPSFTVNRAYFPGEAYVAYDMNDYLPYFGTEMSAGILTDIVMQDFYSPAFATVNLRAAYDPDSRQLDIEATGKLLPEATAIYGDMALTLLITEDSVISQQSVYNFTTQRTSVNRNYRHQDVLRAYITAPTGHLLTPDGGQYAATFTTTLDDSWVPRHLHLVGLLTKNKDKVTDGDLLDMDVINATSIPLSENLVTSIAAVKRTMDRPDQGDASAAGRDERGTARYSLDGRPAKSINPRGIFIMNGKKQFVR